MPLRDNMKWSDFPLLTAVLIAINVFAFFGWQGGERLDMTKVVLFSAIPHEITHPGQQCAPTSPRGDFECHPQSEQEARYAIPFPSTWVTLFTSMFMHGSIGHLIGNMLFLFVFGIALELGLGRRSFLLFYLVGGFGATLGHTIFESQSMIPSLGASGAISAVMGGYVMLFPRAKIFTWLIPPLPLLLWIRAAWLIGFLMIEQVIVAYLTLSAFGDTGGVAYFAHFGGFLAGVALVLAVLDRDSIEELRREARIASGDETRLDPEVIESPPTQQAPEQAPQPQVQPAPTFAADPFSQPMPQVFAPDPFAPRTEGGQAGLRKT